MRTLLLLAALASASGCGRGSGESGPPPREPVRVAMVELAVTAHQPELRKTAFLESRVRIELGAETDGTVLERKVAEGERVQAGDRLLLFRSEVERAQVEAARESFHGLAVGGAEPALVAEAKAALSRAEDALRRRTIIAPAPGILEKWVVDPGEHVVPGRPVAMLVDPDRLFAATSLLQDEARAARPGTPCTVVHGSGPADRVAARLAYVAPAADPGRGTFRVEADLDDPAGLLVGSRVEVLIPLGAPEPALLVPAAAVRTHLGESEILVAVPDGAVLRARTRAVRTVPVPGRVDVLRVLEGAKPGDRVITRGLLGLRDGDQVVPSAGGP